MTVLPRNAALFFIQIIPYHGAFSFSLPCAIIEYLELSGNPYSMKKVSKRAGAEPLWGNDHLYAVL